MRWRVAVAALLLLAAPATASLLESATDGLPVHVHYQVDGGTDHDAPDTCQEVLASPLPFDLPVGGNVQGLLVPVDDTADHYRIPIGQDLVGGRVTVTVLGRNATLPFEMDVIAPLCGTSVTAPENQPLPPPSHPAPGPGQRQAEPHNLDDAGSGSCSSRWFFVLNQFGGRAPPPTIHAVWTDGSEADIRLLKNTPATIAQYATREHLGFTLHSVTALVPADWSGQFNVAEAPCGAVEGTAVFGEPSVSGEASIEFTPTQAGAYVLAVRAVPPAVPEPSDLVGPQPRSCHAACRFFPAESTDSGGYEAFTF
jgi:hypothetical protein